MRDRDLIRHYQGFWDLNQLLGMKGLLSSTINYNKGCLQRNIMFHLTLSFPPLEISSRIIAWPGWSGDYRSHMLRFYLQMHPAIFFELF